METREHQLCSLSFLQHGSVPQSKSFRAKIFGITNWRENEKTRVNDIQHFVTRYPDLIYLCLFCTVDHTAIVSYFWPRCYLGSGTGFSHTVCMCVCVCTFTVQLSILVCHCCRFQAFATQGTAETGFMPRLHTQRDFINTNKEAKDKITRFLPELVMKGLNCIS